jgi:FkbM family methyltransferase
MVGWGEKFGIYARSPLRLPKLLMQRIGRLYKLHVVKDELEITVSKWFRDGGDKSLRLDYALTSESVVFDLGGYKGDFAFQINRKYDCYVYVYEPVNKFYLGCVERFKNNNKIKCFNYGLADRGGALFVGDDEDGSSAIRNNKSGGCERVLVKSFLDEFNDLGLPRIDLLKINIEGPEFTLLPHIISSGVINNITDIQVQFHDFYPNAIALREEIRGGLSGTHEEKWNYPFVWESWAKKAEPARLRIDV